MRNARLWLAVTFSLPVVIYAVLVILLANSGHVAAQNPELLRAFGTNGSECRQGNGHGSFETVPCPKDKPAVPFDVPPKETKGSVLGYHNCKTYDQGHGTVSDCTPYYGPSSITCEDSKRVLLTDEAGERHCFAFWLLGDSNPR